MNIRVLAKKPFYDLFYLAPTMPNFLRLALIDSLSYNSTSNSGGTLNNFDNYHFKKQYICKGLSKTLKDINEISKDGNHITVMLSKADLIQIGGAAAIEYTGGPEIDIKVGRKDNTNKLAESSFYPEDDYDSNDILKLKENLKLSDSELVALFGYRTLGFHNNNDEKRETRWSANPWVFDNNYYYELLSKNSPYLKTPSDKVLLNDSSYLEYVHKYANDFELFKNEFKNVYEKVSNSGYKEGELLKETINDYNLV